MKKPYLTRIVEQRTKDVIIWAESRDEATATGERLCVEGAIDMSKDNRECRDVLVQFKAEDYDFNIFEQFNKG